MATYRTRRLKASTREHLADAAKGITAGVIGAVVLLIITVAVLTELSIAI
jgi:hypothetical protein